MSDDIDVVRRLFTDVEDRDFDGLMACYSDDAEIHEADVLPYGGIFRGREGIAAHAQGFMRAWGELQGAEEARLDAQFFADGAGTVCAVFRHRAVDPESGARFDAPEVGVDQVRGQQVVRSQMFHADSAAVVEFLNEVGDEPSPRS